MGGKREKMHPTLGPNDVVRAPSFRGVWAVGRKEERKRITN